jgi:hypothetical protein
MDGGHVKGFIEVFFPRVIHWSKGKGTLKEGFDNKRLEGRPSLVYLIRFEPPKGKMIRRGRVLGRWSRKMSFKKRSSKKVESERPLGGFSRQAREEDLG